MKRLLRCSPLFLLVGIGCMACEEGGANCPAGMHEQQLQDGFTICVPDHIAQAGATQEAGVH